MKLALDLALVGFVHLLPAQAPSAEQPKPNPMLTSGYFVLLRVDELGARPGGVPGDAISASPKARVERKRAGLLLRPDGMARQEQAWIELPELESPSFREVVCSWNVVVPESTGACFELRVRGEAGEWSPWLYLGDCGVPPAGERTVRFDGGHIETDCFVSEVTYSRAQLRVRAARSTTGDAPIVLERVSLCVSDRSTERDVAMRRWSGEPPPSVNRPPPLHGPKPGDPPVLLRNVQLDVPFRSQKVEDPRIASRICSPTSVAMVLDYRGVDVPTKDLAARIWDREHEMYGNWPRAVQVAFELGVPGYLTRFSRWSDVEREIKHGQPLVISIRAAKGQLTGAPYEKTDGHLLVLCGFDANGDCLVNDPAARDAEHGQITYKRSELEQCWMGHGGVAYVLLPRPAGR